MPEGPEVRREADRIARVLVGEPLIRAEFGLDRLARYARVLRNARVVSVQTRGKALLTHFDNALTLYSHNQLYGRWIVCRRDNPPSTGRTLRVGLHTASHSALLFSASDIEMLETAAVDTHPFIARLGPDVLDADLSWRDVSDRLQMQAFRRRSLAAVLLDQGFLAGIGNYLRSEILHEARAHPLGRPAELGRGDLGRLARAILAISHRAYRTGGVTNAARRVDTLKRQGYPRRDYRFAVFGREGLPCYRCHAPVRRTTAAGRRLYYCPGCQGDVRAAQTGAAS